MQGIEYLRPWGKYVYLVRITPEQASTIQKFDFVRWVGPFYPAYRIHPELLKDTESIQNIEVTIYGGGQERHSADHTIEAIEVLGGELVHQSISSVSPPEVTAVFMLPTSVVTDVAQLSGVIQLYYWTPPFLEDEESNQNNTEE